MVVILKEISSLDIAWKQSLIDNANSCQLHCVHQHLITQQHVLMAQGMLLIYNHDAREGCTDDGWSGI